MPVCECGHDGYMHAPKGFWSGANNTEYCEHMEKRLKQIQDPSILYKQYEYVRCKCNKFKHIETV